MKEKRVYIITGAQMIDAGEPIGEVYMPDFSVLPELIDVYRAGTDDDYWDVVYSKLDTDGIHDSAVVGIYTTIENHELLEAEPHIKRIDDKPNKKALFRAVNGKVPDSVVDKLKEKRK